MVLPFNVPPPRPDIPWIETDPNDGRATLQMAQYVVALDALVRQLASGQVGTLVSAVNDAAAAQAGVPVGGLYRNGSQVLTRVA